MNNLVALEKSTNTHTTKSNVTITDEFEKMTTVIIETNNSVIVEHGHHHTVATEPDTEQVIKITQQEFNPVLNAFQNAFD